MRVVASRRNQEYRRRCIITAVLGDSHGANKSRNLVAAQLNDIEQINYTNRLRSTAAPTKLANSGCGANGRDLSSG